LVGREQAWDTLQLELDKDAIRKISRTIFRLFQIEEFRFHFSEFSAKMGFL